MWQTSQSLSAMEDNKILIGLNQLLIATHNRRTWYIGKSDRDIATWTQASPGKCPSYSGFISSCGLFNPRWLRSTVFWVSCTRPGLTVQKSKWKWRNDLQSTFSDASENVLLSILLLFSPHWKQQFREFIRGGFEIWKDKESFTKGILRRTDS